MISRPRRIAARALLAGGALIAGLVAAEFGVRAFAIHPRVTSRPKYVDPEGVEITTATHGRLYLRDNPIPQIEYELRPGGRAFFQYDTSVATPDYLDEHGRVAIEINAHGLRDVEFPLEPAADTHRILCLGDSFTFGFGVRLEDGYPKQLERLLARSFPGQKFEVLNGGFAAGGRLSNHVAYLLYRGHTFRPRTVILTVCLNDIGAVPLTILGWTKVTLPGTRWSRLVDLLSNAVTNWRGHCLAADPDACFVRACGGAAEDPVWRQSLRAARSAGDKLGIRLLVAIYPMMDGLGSTYPWTRIHDLVREFCEAERIEVVDLFPAFRGRHDRDLWVHPSDQHPNPTGHAIAARALAAALESRGWLRWPPGRPASR